MSDAWNDFLAFGSIVGMASGLGSVFWHIRNWRNDRLDIRLNGSIHRNYDPSFPSVAACELRISLANHGRREVQICELLVGRTDGSTVPVRVEGELPLVLNGGLAKTLTSEVDVFIGNVSELYAVDGRGKSWPMHQVDFLKLQREVRHVLERLDVEEDAKTNQYDREWLARLGALKGERDERKK